MLKRTGFRRRSKYYNKRTIVDGRAFASRKEAARYEVLRDLEAEGKIRELDMQHSFSLEVNGMLICRYLADFTYIDVDTNAYIVEDVKGIITDLYRLKKKLMKACLDIDILET
jgi:hypothetical protein